MRLSRREFSKLGAMGLAAGILPSAMSEARQQDANRRIGYCVIGLGRIADHFIAGVQDSSTSQHYRAGERASG